MGNYGFKKVVLTVWKAKLQTRGKTLTPVLFMVIGKCGLRYQGYSWVEVNTNNMWVFQ